MDFDSCNQLYEDFPSLLTPEYNIDELDEILRSTDANLSSGIGFDGFNFPSQPMQTYPSPPASSVTSNCENVKSDTESPSHFNHDDFINFFSDEDSDSKSTKCANRNTPSPSNSSTSGISGDSVQSMIVDTPPISPPSSVFQLAPTIIPIAACPTPVNVLQGTLIPVKTVPLTPVQLQTVRAPIKISPKPAPITPKTTTTNPPAKAPKTIVLSNNDFKALMQKMQKNKANGVSMPKIIMKTTSSVKPIQTNLSVVPNQKPNTNNSMEVNCAINKPQSLGIKGIIDDRHLKKQQRMIKNRESASLSRKKKKDYVVSLESRINDLEKENTNLKGENTTLRSQLIAFAQACQCSHLKISEFISNKINTNATSTTCHTNSNSNFKDRLLASNMKKNTAVLLAMVFMVSLNFGGFHTYFSQDDMLRSTGGSVDFNTASMYTGRRSLLWSDEAGTGNVTNPLDGNDLNSTETDDKCPISINQTENLRLAGELRKWIGVNDYLNLSSVQEKPEHFKLTPEFLELKSMSQRVAKSVKTNSKRSRRMLVNRQLQRNKKMQENSKNSLKIFRPQIDDEYLRLFEEIKRRDDTFYVLSFNSDHILLPAAAYNKSTRPKMALMLPAGDPSMNGSITLMQIDCEVLNTTEVQLQPNMIPANLRPKFNFHTPSSGDVLNKTGGGPEKRAARNAYGRANGSVPKPIPFYRPYFMAVSDKEVKEETPKKEPKSRVNSMAKLTGAQYITFQHGREDYGNVP